jgi:hypothetical protein
MNSDSSGARSLREIEMEVLAEGREWMRQRLEQKLQEEADRHGGVFPPEQPKGSAPAETRHDRAQRRRTRSR